MSTKLKKFGIIRKTVTVCCLMICITALGVLFPPLWFGLLVAPFLFIGYRAGGSCPVCGGYVEVTKRRGGCRCRGCGSGLIIRKKRLWKV